jgi:XTP/dITP diphosphohydrolase
VRRPHGIVVASKNADKISEIEAVLASLEPPVVVIPGHTWADVDETELTLEGNALLKARAVVAATGHAAVADDTGLEVAALGGAPGVATARYAGEDATYDENVTKLLAEMEGVEDRRARFRTAVALVTPSGDEMVVEGVLEGFIATARRGDGGFGYDPVFEISPHAVSDPSNRAHDALHTLAELSPEEKNTVSHRAKALRALAEAMSRGSEAT